MTDTQQTLIQFDDLLRKARGDFHGGIHPQEFKLISNKTSIKTFAQPPQLTIPIQQSVGDAGKVIVSNGDTVIAGQLLVAQEEGLGSRIHAPFDGRITQVKPAYTGHPSGLPKQAIILETNAEKAFSIEISEKPSDQWINVEPQTLLKAIHDAGIVGLGGATFPTDVKLSTPAIDTLIVNAMECEPYITCDDRLLQEQSAEVIVGAQVAAKIIGAKDIIFATEDNKPDATAALTLAVRSSNHQFPMSIVVAPTKYPSGGEKQTIELVTGKQVPTGKLPSALSIVVQNVATLYAIYDAVCNHLPLTRRLVTLTGDLVETPGNYWISFGTPIEFIINDLQIDRKKLDKVIIGGPLMGQSITDFSAPVTKATNCLIFNNAETEEKLWLTQATAHQPCIRCSECQIVCPAELLPQQLFWFSATEQWDNIEQQGLFDCIECGACAYVCPSEIPLVQYYRFAKSTISKRKQEQAISDHAKQRFDFREMRLQRNKAERAEKHQQAAEARRKAAEDKAQDPSGKKAAISAALERVKQKKIQHDEDSNTKNKTD